MGNLFVWVWRGPRPSTWQGLACTLGFSGHRCVSAFPQAGPQLRLTERCSSYSLSLGTCLPPDPSTLMEPNWSLFVSRLCFLVFCMNFSATAWVLSNFINGKRKCFLSLTNHCFHSFIWKLFTLAERRTYNHHEDIGVDMAHLKRHLLVSLQGCPDGAVVEPTYQCRRHKRCEFRTWVEKIPWSSRWLPTPVLLPGEFQGQSSLAGYSPGRHKESDMTGDSTSVVVWGALTCV